MHEETCGSFNMLIMCILVNKKTEIIHEEACGIFHKYYKKRGRMAMG
jgi:hypothetical protein